MALNQQTDITKLYGYNPATDVPMSEAVDSPTNYRATFRGFDGTTSVEPLFYIQSAWRGYSIVINANVNRTFYWDINVVLRDVDGNQRVLKYGRGTPAAVAGNFNTRLYPAYSNEFTAAVAGGATIEQIVFRFNGTHPNGKTGLIGFIGSHVLPQWSNYESPFSTTVLYTANDVDPSVTFPGTTPGWGTGYASYSGQTFQAEIETDDPESAPTVITEITVSSDLVGSLSQRLRPSSQSAYSRFVRTFAKYKNLKMNRAGDQEFPTVEVITMPSLDNQVDSDASLVWFEGEPDEEIFDFSYSLSTPMPEYMESLRFELYDPLTGDVATQATLLPGDSSTSFSASVSLKSLFDEGRYYLTGMEGYQFAKAVDHDEERVWGFRSDRTKELVGGNSWTEVHSFPLFLENQTSVEENVKYYPQLWMPFQVFTVTIEGEEKEIFGPEDPASFSFYRNVVDNELPSSTVQAHQYIFMFNPNIGDVVEYTHSYDVELPAREMVPTVSTTTAYGPDVLWDKQPGDQVVYSFSYTLPKPVDGTVTLQLDNSNHSYIESGATSLVGPLIYTVTITQEDITRGYVESQEITAIYSVGNNTVSQELELPEVSLQGTPPEPGADSDISLRYLRKYKEILDSRRGR